MGRIELTGLRPDLPIGAMAAFGCFRVCQRLPEFQGSKLGWASSGGSDYAVLYTPGEGSREALIGALVDDVGKAGDRKELTWSEQIKTVSAAEYRQYAEGVLKEATADDRETADWFAAFGSELQVGRDEKLDSTPFDMSVARQKFLADARRLAVGLSEGAGKKGRRAPGAYEEALFGPWLYADDQHSLGWDPSTMKLGAFTYKAPTTMANAGVRAAVWLAFESLPLFPCFYRNGISLPAFRSARREFTFCWPVWRAAIGLETLKSLLAWAGLTEEDPPAAELAARGISTLYRSARFKPNQYLASFRTPELVFGGAAAAGRT